MDRARCKFKKFVLLQLNVIVSRFRCPLLNEGFPSARYFIDTFIKFIRSFINNMAELFF